MISKLPRWVWSGAWALAFVAGVVNVVNLMGPEPRAVSHMTGNTTALAIAVAGSDWSTAARVGGVLGAFLVGTVLSGIVIQDGTLRLGRRYGISLMLESILLFVATLCLQHGYTAGTYMSATACGLQNGLVSLYSGAIVRTTHLTGVYTDLGTSIGHLLRGRPVDTLRIRLYLILISAFVLGGIVGGKLYLHGGPTTLLLPAMITGAAALSYYIYRRIGPRVDPID